MPSCWRAAVPCLQERPEVDGEHACFGVVRRVSGGRAVGRRRRARPNRRCRPGTARSPGRRGSSRSPATAIRRCWRVSTCSVIVPRSSVAPRQLAEVRQHVAARRLLAAGDADVQALRRGTATSAPGPAGSRAASCRRRSGAAAYHASATSRARSPDVSARRGAGEHAGEQAGDGQHGRTRAARRAAALASAAHARRPRHL